jgi:outer membrane protein assembly factor BamB
VLSLRVAAKVDVFGNKRKRRSVIQRAPVITNSHIYLNDRRIEPSSGGEVVCLDRNTLAISWRVASDHWAPIAMCGPQALLVQDDFEFRTGLLDTVDRRIVWQREGWGRLWRGHLVIDTASGFDIVDPETGRALESVIAEISPAVLGDDIFIGHVRDRHGHIMAYGAESRRPLWERNLAHEIQSEFGVDHPEPVNIFAGSLPDRFLATSGAGFVMACSREDGRILWKTDVHVPYHVPLVFEARIPILAGIAANRFVVIDEATGEVPVESRPDIGLVVHQQRGSIFKNRVVFTSESGHIAMFDLESGSLLWREEYPVTFWGSAVAHERLLVPAADGNLWVFEAI